MTAQREWFEKDYYAVLGVPSSATAKELSRAYKKLAKEHHPDINPGNKVAEDRFKEVNAAYDVLGDAEKRTEYDEVRRMVASGVGPGGFGPPGAGGNSAGSRSSSTMRSAVRAARSRICSAGSSAVEDAGAAGAARPVRNAARTSRPSCISRSTTPCAASPAPCGSAPTRRARRATVRARRRERSRDVPAVSRQRFDRGRPGTVLVLAGVPHVWRARPGDPDPVPDVSRPGRRDAGAR